MTVVPPLPDRNKLNTTQKQRLRAILYASGIAFLLLGGYIIAKPEAVYDFIGLDRQIAMILGGSFMLVGTSDFLIARFVFSEVDRR